MAKKSAKKSTAKKGAAKKSARATKATARKSPAKKAAAKKAPAKKAAAKKAPARKAAATKKAPAKKSARKPNPAFMKPMQPDAALGAVVGNNAMPRSEITKRVWDYIKKNGLQDQKNKRQINADDKLRPVFGGKKSVTMFEMTKLVNQHLSEG